MNPENRCEKCFESFTNPKILSRKFITYNPLTKKYEDHFLCDKCVTRLVDDWFSPIKTSYW